MRRFLALGLSVVVAACADDSPVTPEVDAGPDVVERVNPVGISEALWASFESLSPESVPMPEDSTNKWAHDPAAVRLGQYLFFEPALSGNGKVSCASCHKPEHGFASEMALSTEGVRGAEYPLGRHTPSLLNVGYFLWQFWDGRRDTLWGQAIVPMENPVEMAGSRTQLVHYIYETPAVKTAYEDLFGALPEIGDFPRRAAPVPNPTDADTAALNEAWSTMTPAQQNAVNDVTANAIKAIAAYEMQLVRFNAPFDRYVQQMRDFPTEPQKWDAIGDDAKEGARLFVDVIGCAKCHSGPLLSDGKFHNLRLPPTEGVDVFDLGRFSGIGWSKDADFSSASPHSDDPEGQRALLLNALPALDRDKGAFRTPALRNLLSTAPYMHGGHFKDLDEVMEFYNKQPEPVGVGTRSYTIRELKLQDNQLAFVRAFLDSLEGDPLPSTLTEAPDDPRMP